MGGERRGEEGLFADAEAREDGVEDFGRGYLAGDGAEVVEGVAEVDGEEVGWEAVVEALEGSGEGLLDAEECVAMAGVGEEDVGVGGVAGGVDECPTKVVEAGAGEGGEGEGGVGSW